MSALAMGFSGALMPGGYAFCRPLKPSGALPQRGKLPHQRPPVAVIHFRDRIFYPVRANGPPAPLFEP
ncbi:MAG: hypothetical protein ACK4GT_06285, partial [Pararhodobacter sp.]